MDKIICKEKKIFKWEEIIDIKCVIAGRASRQIIFVNNKKEKIKVTETMKGYSELEMYLKENGYLKVKIKKEYINAKE